jgi:hypothetical protein
MPDCRGLIACGRARECRLIRSMSNLWTSLHCKTTCSTCQIHCWIMNRLVFGFLLYASVGDLVRSRPLDIHMAEFGIWVAPLTLRIPKKSHTLTRHARFAWFDCLRTGASDDALVSSFGTCRPCHVQCVSNLPAVYAKYTLDHDMTRCGVLFYEWDVMRPVRAVHCISWIFK